MPHTHYVPSNSTKTLRTYSKERWMALMLTAASLACLAVLIRVVVARSILSMILCVLAGYFAVVCAAVPTAMRFNAGNATCKRADGSIPLTGLLLWGPWIFSQILFIYYKRIFLKTGLPVISEISPGLFLGGVPAFYKFDSEKASFTSVVDLTCEIPRMRNFGEYLTIPTWDGTAVLPDNIEQAVSWISKQRTAGKSVLVHCCYGIGRSATVMCAALLRSGICKNVDDAVAFVVRRRKQVHLTTYHLAALREWALLYNTKKAR